MHIFEVFGTEEDDEALEKTDILSQEAQGDRTVDIQGSILMTTTLKILVPGKQLQTGCHPEKYHLKCI